MSAALDLAERFDGFAAWAALSEDVRSAIGAAVLSKHVAELVIEQAHAADDPVRERVGIAADEAAQAELAELLAAVDVEGGTTAAGRPRVPALLGMVCESCGCSEMDACPCGCGWARDGLCTACATTDDGVAHAQG